MKNVMMLAGALMISAIAFNAQPANARIVTCMPVVAVDCCGTDAAVLSIDLSHSPPACSYPFGMYAQCPDYSPDFYAGHPSANVNVVLPSSAIICPF